MNLFEESLGMVIACALKSVEAVQTLDLPAMLQHTADVLVRNRTDSFVALARKNLAVGRVSECQWRSRASEGSRGLIGVPRRARSTSCAVSVSLR